MNEEEIKAAAAAAAAAVEEAALDKSIEDSVEAVKAGQTLEAQPEGQTGETGPTGATAEADPTGETGATGENDGNSQATGATGEDDFRIPNKGKFETDESYEKRIEVFDLVKLRKAAITPEAKAAISEKIKVAKGELKALGNSEKIIQPKDDKALSEEEAADPTLKADRERLKALGGATKEDIAAEIRAERIKQEIQSDLTKFVDEAKELKDPDVREVFFDYVDANFNWQGKSGKELRAVLGMAYEAMFRPAESIQDRVLKGAKVAEKVNAMQFPGGTGNEPAIPADKKADIDALVATGMTKEKAMELVSD